MGEGTGEDERLRVTEGWDETSKSGSENRSQRARNHIMGTLGLIGLPIYLY